MPVQPKALWRSAVSRGFEILLVLPAIAVISSFGLAGDVPMLVWTALILVVGVVMQPEAQHWLSGARGGRRTWLGPAVHFAITTALVYAGGWGPVTMIAYPVVMTKQLRIFGSAVSRQAILWTVTGIVAGQAGIALGWVYSYLPATYAQVAGLSGALGVVMFIREQGRSAEQAERAEGTMRASEERFRALVQDSGDVVAVVDLSGTIQYISPAVLQVTGFRPEELTGTSFGQGLHPDDLPAATALWGEVVADPGGQHRIELRIRHMDGDWRWAEMTVRNLLDNPAVAGLVANYRDVTDRRAVQERLLYDASHDQLTGLSNRASFLRGLELAWSNVSHATGAPAALFIDLDGFKEVNDTLGHRNGDALIVAVAGALRRCVLGSDIVGRLGGDEFGVILTTISSPDDALIVVRRILAELDLAVPLDGHEVLARASIGVAVSGPGCRDAKNLLQHADTAMYGAKRRGTHGFQVYVPGRDADDTLAGVSGSRGPSSGSV